MTAQLRIAYQLNLAPQFTEIELSPTHLNRETARNSRRFPCKRRREFKQIDGRSALRGWCTPCIHSRMRLPPSFTLPLLGCTIGLALLACGQAEPVGSDDCAQAACDEKPPVDDHSLGATSTGGSPASEPPLVNEPPINKPSPDAHPEDFVRTIATDMIDSEGNKVVLRTMNLGNWFLWEGYMWGLHPGDGRGVRHRAIEERIRQVLGSEETEEFSRNYRKSYIRAEDMTRIRSWGFNSIRLPLNARLLLPEDATTFNEEAFQELDAALQLAQDAGLYVVLDMHAAPGGQSGKDIDDSPRYCPDLFTEPLHQERLVALWTEIARRYAENTNIAGYDLLNEPIPWRDQISEECRPTQIEYDKLFILGLWPLYRRLGQGIRLNDPHHMLIVEGAHWGSDVDISLSQPFDDNLAYSFHYYHTAPNQALVQKYVDARKRFNRPFWVGEFGEDSPDHYRAVARLFDQNDFGWAFWTWKRMGGGSVPYHVEEPSSWNNVRAYLQGEGSAPSPEVLREALEQLLSAATSARKNDEVASVFAP